MDDTGPGPALFPVVLEQCPAPATEERLHRAYEVILQAAARAEDSHQQAAEPTQENIPRGATEGCPHDEPGVGGQPIPPSQGEGDE